MQPNDPSEPTRLVCHRCGFAAEGVLGDRCPRDLLALIPEAEHARRPRDAMLGRILGGKYPLVGVLGVGGMGAVYRALQEPVGREVAVKLIRPVPREGTAETPEEIRSRFFNEAKTVARLSNPATVSLHDYGAEPDGLLYMVLELVRGQTLMQLIVDRAPLRPERAVPIACQVLHALTEAHRLQLIHRDLKPANVMIVAGPWGDEQAKVLDFGIAKVLGAKDSSIDTAKGLLLGTPSYMAPEQVTGHTSPQSDLYSVGVLLYEMLSGKQPFVAETPIGVALAHREQPVPPFAERLKIPPPLQAAVMRALAKTPEQRFPDAATMAETLLKSLEAAGPATTGRLSWQSMVGMPEVKTEPDGVLPPEIAELAAKRLEEPRQAEEGEEVDLEETGRAALRRSKRALAAAAGAAVLLAAAAFAVTRGRSAPASPTQAPAATPAAALRAALPPVEPASGPSAPEPRPAAPIPAPQATAPDAPGREPVRRPAPPAPRPRGTLSVNCIPWCRVFLDGRDTGKTTPILGMSVPAGTHSLRLVNAGAGLEAEREVTVKAGEEARVVVEF